MSVTELNTRRKEVLQAAVETYIETASPVSSSAIAKRMRLKISTATIRNIMAQLHDLGLLWQPHTSAGRVPTDEGYRYYIDSLIKLQQLSLQEKDSIAADQAQKTAAFDDCLSDILRILSNFSGYTSLAFSSYAENKLYIERLSCILEHPEFQNLDKFQPLLKTFERQNPLLQIMRDDLNPDGIKVHIGHENHCQEIQECSLVVSNFKINGESVGVLGVIGPRRMSYRKVVSIVDYIASIFGDKGACFDV